MRNDLILGLDISTSVIGYSIIDMDKTLHSLSYIKLSKEKDLLKKVDIFTKEMNQYAESVKYVAIEEPLVAYKDGFSRAQILSLLSQFNGMCQLATYLLYNYISTLPRETLESAFIDGASHFTVFTRLVLPLSVPALASFAIFQFLWVWNDYLVALVFLGGNPEFELVTQRMAAIVGARGQDWHLLTAGAFVSMSLPLLVFFSLQRYFVRGLLAGSVKG